jgi:hypothetical protein
VRLAAAHLDIPRNLVVDLAEGQQRGKPNRALNPKLDAWKRSAACQCRTTEKRGTPCCRALNAEIWRS